MVVHPRPIHLARAFDPLQAPTGVAGIDSGATIVATSAAAQATSLAVDSSATDSPVQSAPPLDITNPGSIPATTITQPSPSAESTSSPSSASPAPTAVAATSSISLSTVVGSCVGAFIGASALIVLGLWFYRRYSRSLKQQAKTRGPLIHSRNQRGDEQRRRSRLEPWNKLDDEDDNKYQMTETKDVDQVGPMEKLTMFKKTPSVRTAYTHKSTDVSAFHYPESYAEFDPKLAQALSAGKAAMPKPRPFLAQVDMGSDMSWDGQTAGNGSFLSVHSQISGGAMSPSTRMAIPTPPPTEPQAHRWESAEVVQYSDANTSESANPFGQDEQRKSTHNPFFNAQDYQPRSRSNSVTKSPKAKGKERMWYSTATDPFDDLNGEITMPPRPVFAHHVATASSSSTESKEKALQSLIAALEMPEDQVRDRLRIASMQPSIISQASSNLAYDEDMTKEFPLPPARPDGPSSSQPSS